MNSQMKRYIGWGLGPWWGWGASWHMGVFTNLEAPRTHQLGVFMQFYYVGKMIKSLAIVTEFSLHPISPTWRCVGRLKVSSF